MRYIFYGLYRGLWIFLKKNGYFFQFFEVFVYNPLYTFKHCTDTLILKSA